MWRLTASAVLLAIAALAPAGCKRRSHARAAPVEDDSPLESVVNVADLEDAAQLIAGFHNVENNAWRWTMGHFSATLRPPEDSSLKGAVLELKGDVPSAVLKRLGPISLSATINGHTLYSETFSRAGAFTYSQEVPASVLSGDSARVDFAVDKALPPSGQDARELALVVTSIGLLPSK
jgi:hypothetical protein